MCQFPADRDLGTWFEGNKNEYRGGSCRRYRLRSYQFRGTEVGPSGNETVPGEGTGLESRKEKICLYKRRHSLQDVRGEPRSNSITYCREVEEKVSVGFGLLRSLMSLERVLLAIFCG